MALQDKYPQPSSRYKRFPRLGADEAEIIGFRDSHFAHFQTYRNSVMANIVRNILYRNGDQWIERDTETISDGARGYVWRAMQVSADVERPKPVDNRITASVDVEFATLSKRQWGPKIPPFSRDPRQEASKKVAQEILQDRLKKLQWDDKRDQFIRNDIVHGTAIFKSFWNESYYETTWISSPEAMQCQQCGQLYSSPVVAGNDFRQLPNAGSITGVGSQDADEFTIENCPSCGGPLQKVELDEEMSQQSDFFKRPLGIETPKGNTDLELVSPFEYYPQNSGIFVTPISIKQHGIVKIRSLDWIEEHYPWLEGQIMPEPPEELMRYHPTLGQWDFLGRYHHGWDSGLFDCHARVYEMYAEPTYRYPEGHSIVVIGRRQNIIAVDEPLVVKIQDEITGEEVAVPKVSIAIAVWKENEDILWGRGLPDDIISPQNRINGIDSQTVEARERMGSPNLIVPEDADIQGPEFNANYGLGKIFRYQLSAISPQAKPEVFGSILMPEGVNEERRMAEESITKIIGPADIEIGEAPRNVTTTSGLQILGEQAERRRGTRERYITSAFQKVWEHQMQMLWVLRVDEDYYEAKTPDGAWELKQYNRSHIAGHTKVEIEKQAYIENSIILREGAREALVDGLYGPVQNLSPMALKKMLELRGLPTDVNEDSNLQIDHARRTWVDFVDEQKIPTIDWSIDNPTIYFQVLGAMLKQDEGLQLSEDSGWSAIVGDLAGWEDEYRRVVQQDAMIRQLYPDEDKAPEAFAQATIAYQQALTGYQTQKAMGTLVPGQAPPQEPPPPNFLPRQVEKRILLVWADMLKRGTAIESWLTSQATKLLKPQNEMQQKLDIYLRFRAYVEGYRMLSGGMGPAPGTLPQGVMPEGAPQAVPPTPGAQMPGPSPTQNTPPAAPVAAQ